MEDTMPQPQQLTTLFLVRHRASPRRPVPPVDLIEPRRQRRTDQQIVMPATRRDAPAQQLPRSWQDHKPAGGQLMAIDPGDIGAVGVLLNPADA